MSVEEPNHHAVCVAGDLRQWYTHYTISNHNPPKNVLGALDIQLYGLPDMFKTSLGVL